MEFASISSATRFAILGRRESWSSCFRAHAFCASTHFRTLESVVFSSQRYGSVTSIPWYRSTTGTLSVVGGPDTSARQRNRAEMLRASTDLLCIWTGISRCFGAVLEQNQQGKLFTAGTFVDYFCYRTTRRY